MRITPRTLAVDCGAAHVAVARFTCDRAGRLGLAALGVEVHAAEPGTDARWIGQVAEALASVAARATLGGACRVALPGHLTLTKLVAAPKCETTQRRAAEAQAAAQAMPYPLEQLAWDGRELPGNGPRADLALAAAKTGWMEELGAALIAARLEPTQFEPAVLALARAYRYNYADATEAAVVIDLGARSTAVIWLAPKGPFRVRTVPLGGDAITQALAENRAIDFTAAEACKRQWLESTDDASRDPAVNAAMAEAAEHWMQRLRFEIGRTLSSVGRTEERAAPTRVLLTGGGSLWPGLAEKLSADLGLTVEPYDGLRRVVLPAAADRTAIIAQRHHLPPLIGLATSRLGNQPGTLNLLTPGLRARRRMRRCRPWGLAAAAAFAMAWAGVAWHGREEVERNRRELAGVAAGIASLRQQAAADAVVQESLEQLRHENGQLRPWVDNRGAWAAWLGELQGRLAVHGEVWLDRINLKPPPADDGARALRIEVHGWLLDLRHPLAPPGPEALAQLQAVLADLADMPQVAAVVDEHHDRSRPGRLGFGCTIELAPDHRL